MEHEPADKVRIPGIPGRMGERRREEKWKCLEHAKRKEI